MEREERGRKGERGKVGREEGREGKEKEKERQWVVMRMSSGLPLGFLHIHPPNP